METPVVAADLGIVSETAMLRLSLSAFPVLAENGGSVRLEVGLDQPVIVSRLNGVFYTVGSRCTHNGCTVGTYNKILGRVICPCHGSRYLIDGTVSQGPAVMPLDRFETSFSSDEVLVRLPGITFGARRVEIASISGAFKRVRLSFYASVFTSYQVHYRPALSGNGVAVPFSLTPSGTASQMTYRNTVFNPESPQTLVDLYVDVTGTTGFFSIVLLPYES